MPSQVAVLSADWHLERNGWARRPRLWGDAYYGLEQLTDLALRLRVPLIGAGDLFDRPYPDAATVTFACRQLDRLAAAGLPFGFVTGQHERSRYAQWLGVHPESAHLHGRAMALRGGITAYGVDWQPADRLPDALAAVPPGTGLLVAHQSWRELMGDHLPSEGSLAAVRNARAVLTGDFHGHRVLSVPREGLPPLAVFSPGSVCLQSVAEDPAKYAFVLMDDLTVRSERLRTRPVFYLSVAAGESPAAAAAGLAGDVAAAGVADLPEPVRSPLVVVSCPLDLVDLSPLRRAADAGGWHLIERDDAPAAAAAAAGSVTYAGFEEALAGEADPASVEYADALRLWRAADPAAELAVMVEEALAAGEEVGPCS